MWHVLSRFDYSVRKAIGTQIRYGERAQKAGGREARLVYLPWRCSHAKSPPIRLNRKFSNIPEPDGTTVVFSCFFPLPLARTCPFGEHNILGLLPGPELFSLAVPPCGVQTTDAGEFQQEFRRSTSDHSLGGMLIILISRFGVQEAQRRM